MRKRELHLICIAGAVLVLGAGLWVVTRWSARPPGVLGTVVPDVADRARSAPPADRPAGPETVTPVRTDPPEGRAAPPAPPARWLVRGRVVDEAGKPLAGAHVEPAMTRRGWSSPVGPGPVATDSEGVFAFEPDGAAALSPLARANTLLSVAVTSDLHLVTHGSSLEPPWKPGAAAVLDMGDIVLRRAAAIVRGRIVDTAREPVPGASIRAVADSPTAYATSDGAGRFVLRLAESRAVRIVARRWSVGSAARDVEFVEPPGRGPDDRDLGDVELRTRGVVEGRVVMPDGSGANDLPITLTAGDPEEAGPRFYLSQHANEPRTDADGRFRAAILPDEPDPTHLVVHGLGSRAVFEITGRRPTEPFVVDGQHVTLELVEPDGRAYAGSGCDLTVWPAASRPDPDFLGAVSSGTRMVEDWPPGSRGKTSGCVAGSRVVGLLQAGDVMLASVRVRHGFGSTVVHEAIPGIHRTVSRLTATGREQGGRVKLLLRGPRGDLAESYEVLVKDRWGTRVTTFRAPDELDAGGASPLLPPDLLRFEIEPAATGRVTPFRGDPIHARAALQSRQTVQVRVACPDIGLVKVVVRRVAASIDDELLGKLVIRATCGSASPVEVSPTYWETPDGGLGVASTPLQALREGNAFDRIPLQVGQALVEVRVPGLPIQRKPVDVHFFRESVVEFSLE